MAPAAPQVSTTGSPPGRSEASDALFSVKPLITSSPRPWSQGALSRLHCTVGDQGRIAASIRLPSFPKSPPTRVNIAHFSPSFAPAAVSVCSSGRARRRSLLFRREICRPGVSSRSGRRRAQLETTALRRHQLQVADLLFEGREQLARQTDGLRLVASHRAVFEFQFHDAPSLPASRDRANCLCILILDLVSAAIKPPGPANRPLTPGRSPCQTAHGPGPDLSRDPARVIDPVETTTAGNGRFPVRETTVQGRKLIRFSDGKPNEDESRREQPTSSHESGGAKPPGLLSRIRGGGSAVPSG